MPLSRVQLKENAKARLSGNWGGAILAWLLPGLVLIGIFVFLFVSLLGKDLALISASFNQYGANYFSDFGTNYPSQEMLMMFFGKFLLFYFLFLLCAIFLATPLSYGTYYWNYKLARGMSPKVTDVFYYITSFQRYGSIIAFGLNVGVRTIGWSLLFSIPSTILSTIATMNYSTGLQSIASLVQMATTIGLSIFLYRYMAAHTQLCDSEGIGSSEAIRRSIAATKGRTADMFVMDLSFIGWSLLCIFILPLFYVMPYYYATLAEQYRNISDVYYAKMNNPYSGNYDPNQQFAQPNMQQPPMDQYNNPQGYNAPPAEQYNPTMYTAPGTEQFNNPQPIAPQPPQTQVSPVYTQPTQPQQPVVEQPPVEPLANPEPMPEVQSDDLNK